MTSVHPTVGDTPFYLLHGYDPHEPTKIYHAHASEIDYAAKVFRLNQLKLLRQSRALVAHRLNEQARKVAREANAHEQQKAFAVGSLVMLWRPSPYKKGWAQKLEKRYRGPYMITRVILGNHSPVPINYEIKPTWSGCDPENLETVHANDLRAYRPHLEEVARKLAIPYEVAYDAAYPRLMAQDEFLQDEELADKGTVASSTKPKGATTRHGLTLKEVRRGKLLPLVTDG